MIKILVKNRLSSVISAFLGRGAKNGKNKTSGARVALFIFLYLFLAACFCFMSIYFALGFAQVFIPSGASPIYFAMFIIVTFSFLFLFSIFETKSELFECRDNELLLSMPIKPLDITLSRVCVVLILNYLEELIILGPAVVIYFLFSFDIVGVLGSLLVFLILPPLATALASGVGYIIALISKRVKRKSFIAVLLTVAFLLVYFYFVNVLSESMENIISIGETILVNMGEAPVLLFIGNTVFFKPLPLILFILISALVCTAVFAFISKHYIGIVTASHSSSNKKYKAVKSEKKSLTSALTRKELSRFFSSATYMLNGGIGLIFSLGISVFILIKKSMIFEIAESLELTSSPVELIAPIMISVLVMMQSMNMISASALSLEGKSFWIPKSMPVTAREALLSKSLAQTVITLPVCLVSAVLLAIASGADFKYFVMFILITLASNVFFALLGLALNVAFPKFSFTNEAEVVKQSMPVFLTMTLQFILSVAIIVLNFVTAMFSSGFIGTLITLVLLSALSVGFYFVLTGPCARKYESIDI